jgi:hypothetical protein
MCISSNVTVRREKLEISSSDDIFMVHISELKSSTAQCGGGDTVVAMIEYIKLVGFGRACAPVRCAHPSFWAQ